MAMPNSIINIINIKDITSVNPRSLRFIRSAHGAWRSFAPFFQMSKKTFIVNTLEITTNNNLQKMTNERITS
jgi:hypothetical protein